MEGKYWDQGIQLIDGCTEVSPGCDNCWSREMSGRFPRAKDLVKDGKWTNWIRFNKRFLKRLDRKKPTVFSIWNDLFHEGVPLEFVDECYQEFAAHHWHTILVLTKRPERLHEYCHRETNLKGGILNGGNVWHGTTVENQEQADKRIPELLKCPGNLWLSIEPMLGPIDLTPWIPPFEDCDHYDGGCTRPENVFANTHKPSERPGVLSCWPGACIFGRRSISAVIIGGETGSRARPPELDWVIKVVRDCEAAGIPVFVKYIDKKHGRLLPDENGVLREYNELPWR